MIFFTENYNGVGLEENSDPTSTPSLLPTAFMEDTSHEQSKVLRDQAILVATLSIFFYGSVFCFAAYQYRKFKLQEKENFRIQATYTNVGKFDHAKQLFFRILAISSILEIPSYIGCLAGNGKTDCEWRSPDYLFFWFLHMISLCGYAFCIVIPCILWSDMINRKDGRLFFSEYPIDCVKRYFQVVIILYFVNITVDIFMSIVTYRLSDGFYYRDFPTYAICALIEVILIVFLSCGCLYCGIQLEIHISEAKKAKLPKQAERKLLFTLNVILFVIVLTFLGRAVLVLRFAPNMPKPMQNPVNYPIFILVTRWAPDVFCQVLLALFMRSSGKEVVAKHSSLSYRPSGGGNPILQDSDEYHPDSNEIADMEESLLAVYRLTDPNRISENDGNHSNSGSYGFTTPHQFSVNTTNDTNDLIANESIPWRGVFEDLYNGTPRSSEITRSEASSSDQPLQTANFLPDNRIQTVETILHENSLL